MSRSAPFLPRTWDANRLTIVSVAAVLAPVVAAFGERGSALLNLLAIAIGLAVLWSLMFSWMRRRSFAWDGLVTALVFAAMVPAGVPLWQLALALSFGLVMGGLVFGARGRGFLSPAAVGLAFLLFSFPLPQAASSSMAATVAAMVGGALMLAVGLLSWRVVAGFAAGMVALASPWSMPEGWAVLPSAALILGLVFLVGDPVAGASTNAGRWAYGLLAGALFNVLGHEGGDDLASIVFAALLASIFVPLIDQAVVWANIRRRARRQRDA
ncbi:MAG: hypothetical protein GY798_13100 [Hyphomicrobiales bacterium]|nr:hypothetical protein [Hyphomicrobiales bacterium]